MAAFLATVLLLGSCGSEEKPKKPKSGGGYLDSLARAHQLAHMTACQAQLKSIYAALQGHAASNNGKYPDSLKALSGSLDAAALKCPRPPQKPYEYVAGVDSSAPPDAVLVFDAEAVHDGKCSVLRNDGSVVMMTPAQLRAAKQKTVSRIESRGRR